LGRTARGRDELALVIHTGIYRSDFISEPAIAALAAGDLRINHDAESGGKRTLAFDLMDGPVGTLHACHVAAQMLRGKPGAALVLASEVENNAAAFPGHRIGLKETASAMLLGASADGRRGFGAFHFRSFPQHLDKLQAYTTARDGRPFVCHERHAGLEDAYLECVAPTAAELLAAEGLKPTDVKAVFGPQISPAFGSRLAAVLGLPAERVLTLPDGQGLFTSSPAYAFRHAAEAGQLKPGDVVLVVEVAGGVEVGCATYYV